MRILIGKVVFVDEKYIGPFSLTYGKIYNKYSYNKYISPIVIDDDGIEITPGDLFIELEKHRENKLKTLGI